MGGPNKLCVIVPAAGQSQRMGKVNKLLIPISGVPMVRRVVQTVLAAEIGEVVVVIGHQAGDIERVLDGNDVTFVHNAEYASGMAASLRTGFATVADKCDGALVMLADMPDVTVDVVEALVQQFTGSGDICVPVHEGRRGNPVLWGADYFAEISQLEGDRGAKMLLERFSRRVKDVAVASPAIFADYDSPESLEQAGHENQLCDKIAD